MKKRVLRRLCMAPVAVRLVSPFQNITNLASDAHGSTAPVSP
jgi:hypothetical protein